MLLTALIFLISLLLPTPLAGGMGKLATVGLAAAIFSPWMNISGSLLANCWKRRPADTSPKAPTP